MARSSRAVALAIEVLMEARDSDISKKDVKRILERFCPKRSVLDPSLAPLTVEGIIAKLKDEYQVFVDTVEEAKESPGAAEQLWCNIRLPLQAWAIANIPSTKRRALSAKQRYYTKSYQTSFDITTLNSAQLNFLIALAYFHIAPRSHDETIFLQSKFASMMHACSLARTLLHTHLVSDKHLGPAFSQPDLSIISQSRPTVYDSTTACQISSYASFPSQHQNKYSSDTTANMVYAIEADPQAQIDPWDLNTHQVLWNANTNTTTRPDLTTTGSTSWL
ncbi:hypothetical protein GGP41_009376 [Bipolaris sorokiniana]|uniref:Uncharacterized protein n=1 Tax=Cochliobolus sativus TaxID=45130 RepID=A0A8H5ZA34_COCSA|nr:hypothetical protein GGP41_009376 [Bipolaris sorokiniana]